MSPYEQALARRNTAWLAYEAAKELLATGRVEQLDLAPYIRSYNEAQKEYERAEYDLVRAREQQRWSQEWHGHTITVEEAD
jgi:hypothetical protein